jgi:hypothetical protein
VRGKGEGLTCPRHASGHTRFCEWVDPDSPSYRRRGRGEIVALSRRPIVPAPSDPSTFAEWTPAGPDFPPLLEQAKNLAGSVARFVGSGLKMTTPEERERRLSICHECPEFSGGKCRICGCVARWKARLAGEHCPIQKW